MTIKELRDGLIQDLAENVYDTYWFGLEGTKMICEALDKQIPKKPIKNYAMVNLYYCPTCGAWFTGRSKTHHCVCGQTFDWSEDDDKR